MEFENLIKGEIVDNKTKIQTINSKKKNSVATATETSSEKKVEKEKAINEKEIRAAIDYANKQAKATKTSCEFTYHEKINRVSIKIRDDESNEIIKEIPAEETLEMIEKIWELSGIIVDKKG